MWPKTDCVSKAVLPKATSRIASFLISRGTPWNARASKAGAQGDESTKSNHRPQQFVFECPPLLPLYPNLPSQFCRTVSRHPRRHQPNLPTWCQSRWIIGQQLDPSSRIRFEWNLVMPAVVVFDLFPGASIIFGFGATPFFSIQHIHVIARTGVLLLVLTGTALAGLDHHRKQRSRFEVFTIALFCCYEQSLIRSAYRSGLHRTRLIFFTVRSRPGGPRCWSRQRVHSEPISWIQCWMRRGHQLWKTLP
jgi:hypothetical protein